MAPNRYDQISRHLAREAGGPLWPWLLGLTPAQVRFGRYLPTQFTVPGFPERVSDLIAELFETEQGGRPWAIPLEFQSQADFDMPDRLLVILGLLRLTQHPSEEAGDRYWVGAVVVNLTGQGDASREYEWRGAGLQALLKPRELNLAALDAGEVLDQVERGAAPVEVLAWIPLMQRGDDPAISARWLDLARREPNRKRRAELVLARVFAELVDRQDVWMKALEGWEMIESPTIKALLTEAEAKAEAKGKTEGKAEMLVQVLQKRFKKVPDDLRTRILAEQQSDRLSAWGDAALDVRSLRKFREQTSL
jgi:hypothetical protein